MKTSVLLIFLSLSFISIPKALKAQNKVSAFISGQKNELSFKVEKTSFFVCLSKGGEITGYSILANGTISYDLQGRIDKVGNVVVSYDLHGRIDKIDNERISYDIQDRLSEIGDTKISYDIHGRVESVGEQKVSYDIRGRVEKISLAKVSYNYLGKIDKIDRNEQSMYLNLNN
ncbi:hypothetical protein [Desertivirga arenae]|uniref:hypothetical protein n=1 Tax=Desertivirga arenae TaxID=2810309 RepID=UPI001A97B3FA|nr:hypothetical protein [Pedobacter sp. SYSU D00823]